MILVEPETYDTSTRHSYVQYSLFLIYVAFSSENSTKLRHETSYNVSLETLPG